MTPFQMEEPPAESTVILPLHEVDTITTSVDDTTSTSDTTNSSSTSTDSTHISTPNDDSQLEAAYNHFREHLKIH